MRRIAAVLCTAAVSIALLGAAPAGIGAHRTTAAPAASERTYRNPLPLRLPDGDKAENCADPDVTRGSGADHAWYLYCTSDAIDPRETDASGAPVQHLIPTYRSHDLTHWTYVRDAFTTRPTWVAADAGLWAPEIQHRDGRWLLYYTASDTSLPGGGSAIGVATSTSPTGPWTDTGTPVVAPADNPTGAADRRWTYDPEVVRANGRTYLYFGSYNGGIFVRQLRSDGLRSIASTERRISIANRYEGTNVVRHDGWYYLLASATNCCNGALTGYSVFAARSRSPLGPFRDADGRSILAARVGGTPVLSQNGNRWVGPGHDSAFTDAAGRSWMLYHAVDRTDPYVAGTTDYTKRAVLLDRLTWRDGWPVVRGGAGPSDTQQPAPAAQPGQQDAAAPSRAPSLRPGRTLPAFSDDFRGTALSSRWTWIREPADPVTVSGGVLRWPTQAADLHPPATPLASVLTEPAPKGDYVVEAKVRTTVPAQGDDFNYVQAGVVVYGDDGHYVKLSDSSIFETRQTEFGIEAPSTATGDPAYGNGVVGPVGATWTWLRIARHEVEGRTAYTASTSIDGRHWRTGGTWVADLGRSPRIGLVSLGGAGYTGVFDHIEVSTLRRG